MNAREAAEYVDASMRDVIASLPADSPARAALIHDLGRLNARAAHVCQTIDSLQARASRRHWRPFRRLFR